MQASAFGAAVVLDVAAMIRDGASRERLWAAISPDPRADPGPSENRGPAAPAGDPGESWATFIPERDDLAIILAAGWPDAAERLVHPRSSAYVAPPTGRDGEDDAAGGLAAGTTPNPLSGLPQPGPSGGAADPSGARAQAGPDSAERPTAPEPASILLALVLLLLGGLPLLIDLGRLARRLRTPTFSAGGIGFANLIAPHDRRGSRKGERPRERTRTRPGPLVFPDQMLRGEGREPGDG